MTLAIKRFLDTPEEGETSHRQILFENFGVTVYYAQLKALSRIYSWGWS